MWMGVDLPGTSFISQQMYQLQMLLNYAVIPENVICEDRL